MPLKSVQKFSYKHSRGKCSVVVGEKILQDLPEFLEELRGSSAKVQNGETPQPAHKGKVILFSDSRLKKASQRVRGLLRKSGWQTHGVECEVSEQFKNFRKIYSLYGKLLALGADRNTILLAMGGGVIGDSVGFLAGTYMRGIPWVGIPTTLVAQVDSAVGGKTGVNHSEGKNLMGVFHQPLGVLCDLEFGHSLSFNDRASGLGEIIKYGLTFDPKFYTWLKENGCQITDGNCESLSEVIARCLRLKAQVVEKDEFDERGEREILNFGHTFGHAIEAETGYSVFRHGEAVILGMRLAVRLSVLRKSLDPDLGREIDVFLRNIPIPTLPTEVSTEALVARLKRDKKATNGQVRFILLKDIGQPYIDHSVPRPLVVRVLEEFRKDEEDPECSYSKLLPGGQIPQECTE